MGAGRNGSRRCVQQAGRTAGEREAGLALLAGLALAAPLLLAGGGMMYADWRAREAAREAALAHERLVAGPPGPMLAVEPAARGRDLFLGTCAACHGADGRGLPGLGRDLAQSDLVARLTDAELAALIETGRPQGRPVAMPPRGGRDDLTAGDIGAIVAYVRGLQDPRRMPELPPPRVAVARASEDEQAWALAAAKGDEELAQWIVNGSRLFAATCAACHGREARGLPGLGKDLTTSAYVREHDDESLLAFVNRGRQPGEPGNTTGVAMPPKGGNPALSDDDILDIVAYLRALAGTSVSAGNPPGGP